MKESCSSPCAAFPDTPIPLNIASDKLAVDHGNVVSTPLVKSLRESHRLAISTSRKHSLKREHHDSSEDESDHDAAWHENYFLHSESYDSVKRAAIDMADQGMPFTSTSCIATHH